MSRIIFFMALLGNIIFFLWEVNAKSVNITDSSSTIDVLIEKQIILLSEVSINELGDHKIAIQLQALESETKKIVVNSQAKPIFPEVTPKVVDIVVTAEVLPLDNEVISKPLISKRSMTKQSWCYNIGVFDSVENLKQWQTLNKLEALAISSKDKEVISGFLVYYSRGNTFYRSELNVKKLKKQGVKELWLFREGDLKGHISLGLFRDKVRAIHLKKELLKKKVRAKIMTRYQMETHFFAELMTNDETLKASLLAIDNLQIIECDNN